MAAVAGAVIAVAGGLEASSSARRAASKQRRAANQAAKAQQQAAAEAKASGADAFEQQRILAGLGGQQEQQEAFQALGQSPGQQFLRDQQERALLRNTAAIGGLGGGNIRTALQQQAFGRAQTDIQNQFNRLASISGRAQVGQQLAGQQAAQVGQFQQAGAEARASGILGQSQAQQQTLSQLAGLAAQSGAFNQQQQPAQQPTQQTQFQQQPAGTNTGFSISGGAGLRPIGQ